MNNGRLRLPPMVLSALLIAAAGETGRAQYEFQFSGYAVDMPAYQRLRPQIALLAGTRENLAVNLLRLRLRPGFSLWENAWIAGEYEINSLVSAEPIRELQNADLGSRQIRPLVWNLEDGEKVKIRHLIDRLYFRQNFSFGSLVAGRQRIAWGSGRVWNPTDLFNPINPALFGKIEKEGVDALSFKWNIGSFTDASAVLNPTATRGRYNSALRFRTNAFTYDVSLLAGYFDRRYIAGADVAGNFFDAGLRGEGIYSVDDMEGTDAFVRFIAGIDYQFSPSWYALLEYQYNGEGEKSPSRYRLDRLYAGTVLNLARNYICAQALFQAHPLVMLSGGATANLDDGSAFVLVSAQYSFSDAVTFGAGGMLFTGGMLDEYWYYPSAAYLRAEIAF